MYSRFDWMLDVSTIVLQIPSNQNIYRNKFSFLFNHTCFFNNEPNFLATHTCVSFFVIIVKLWNVLRILNIHIKQPFQTLNCDKVVYIQICSNATKRKKIRAVLKQSCMNVYRTTAPKFQPKHLTYSTLLMSCWD